MPVAAEQHKWSRVAAAAEGNLRHVHLPVVGEVMVPPPDKVAYYAGVGLLAVVGIVEWPLALVICAGHVLADQHMFSRLRGLGEAAEAA